MYHHHLTNVIILNNWNQRFCPSFVQNVTQSEKSGELALLERDGADCRLRLFQKLQMCSNTQFSFNVIGRKWWRDLESGFQTTLRRSKYIALAGLELYMEIRLVLNSL